MYSIKVNQLYVSNFKLFNKEVSPIELKEFSLIVLDGPNGFGKTSMFDVIELALTGKIDRVKANSKNSFKEVLWVNDNSKDCVIKVEFLLVDTVNQKEKKLTVGKFIPALSSSKKNLPNDFSIFETYLSKSFEDVISEEYKVSEKELVTQFKQNFNDIDVSSLFRLIYYVEQENNRAFLKGLEHERYNTLSNIFDTVTIDAEMEEISQLQKELKLDLTSVEKKLKDIESQHEDMLKTTKVSQDSMIEAAYVRLISSEAKNEKDWDKENLIIKTSEMRDRYIDDLNKLKYLVGNFHHFKKEKNNLLIHKYIKDETFLENFVISNNFVNDLEVTQERYKKQVKLYKNYKNMKSLQIFRINWQKLDFEMIFEYIQDLLHDQSEKFDENTVKIILKEIEILASLKKNSSSLSKAVLELNNLRDNLIKEFNLKVEEHKELDEKSCPLCGYNWEDGKKLLKNVESKKESLESLYDETTSIIDGKLEKFYTENLSQLKELLSNYFKEENYNLIKTGSMELLKSSVKYHDKIEAFKQHFSKKLRVEDYCIETLDKTMDSYLVRELKKNLIDTLTKEIQVVPSEIKEKYSELNHTFVNQYGSKEEIIENLNEQDIEKKIDYINYRYYHSSQAEKERLETTKKTTQQEKEEIDYILSKIKNVLGIYEERKRKYYKKIIDELQIVFHIYSGRILQSHQRGLGIFMVQGNTGRSKEIRFVTAQNEHDISNYMSSGQLSAVILALILSINKIYGNKGLDILLIDDPLQTLDDLNIASFVELLRNEFYDKQIFLSTHEDDNARYISYKFEKFGLQSKSLNMKSINYETNINYDTDMNDDRY